MTAMLSPRSESSDRFYRTNDAHASHTAGGTRPVLLQALSARQIAEMSRDALLEAIAELPPPFLTGEQLERLRYSDRTTLERMVHLARHCSRNRADRPVLTAK